MDELKKVIGMCPICKQPNTKKHIFTVEESGKIGTPCDSCLKGLVNRDPSVVMCRSCGSIAAYVDPGIAPNGFVFQPGQKYHIPTCRKCANPCHSFDDIEELVGYTKQNKEDDL